MILALALLGTGIYLAARGQGWTMLATGAVSVIAVLIAWPIAKSLGDSGTVCGGITDAMTPVYERLEQFSVMLNELGEQQLLSDRAKSVAYREKDREALRRAIQEDIARRDWEGALVLVNEMDTAFGYKQEAEQIREDINQKFADHIRRQIQAGVALIDRHTSSQQWSAAFREAERLSQQFPTIEEVRSLANEVEQRRQAFKAKLLEDYNDRIAAKDTDGAITVVKKLDFYLTPEEAVGIQESVRNVFKDKINQLRDGLAEAIHQSRWTEAHKIADEVVRDFPNTLLAKECRDKLDSLKRRAQDGQTSTAGV
ncbi:MAG: hypothetical protein H7144_10405 [Burkholderiales bacterium]|nr:hypothetical protein [Phycisphaerae bacterium]